MKTWFDKGGVFLAAGHLCPDEFARYVSSALAVDELRRANSHLADCTDCRIALAEIRETIDADAVDPSRLDRAIQVIRFLRGEVPVVDSMRSDDEPQGLIQQWIGSLSLWLQQPAAVGSPLAHSKPLYASVRTDLASVFATACLATEVAWAVDPLRVDARYDETGLLQSLRVSVGLRPQLTGNPIIVELSDREGETVALQVSPEVPSAVQSTSRLHGRLEDLNARILIGPRS